MKDNKPETTTLLRTLIKLVEDQINKANFDATIFKLDMCQLLGKQGKESILLPVFGFLLRIKIKVETLDPDLRVTFDVDYFPVICKEKKMGDINIKLYESVPSEMNYQVNEVRNIKSLLVGDYIAYKKTGEEIEALNELPVSLENYEQSLKEQLSVLFDMLNNDLYPLVMGQQKHTLEIPKKHWREGYE